MNKVITRLVVSFALAVAAQSAIADSPDAELKTVEAKTLSLRVPADWKQVATTSEMRAAQFAIAGDGDEQADLVVFHFGGPTGGVKANVERWIGQFDEKDRKIEMSQGTCEAGQFILVDATGTWNKPDGPPFARKTIATPDSRVVNVIVIEEQDDAEDYYFIKLSGKESIVDSPAGALRVAIGVEEDSVKPFKLKDAKN